MQRAGGQRAAGRADSNDAVFASPWETATVEAPVSEPSTGGTPSTEGLLVSEFRPGVSWSSGWRERCVTAPEADPVLVEQYRRLAAVMNNAQATNGVRLVMLTSAAEAEGKTSTALNLALVLSTSYQRRVLLIDADLRRPSLGGLLELSDVPGLGDALRAPADQKLSVIQMTPTFTLLPGGRPDPDPIRWLTSPRMRQILDEAAERFDWVILDSPPMGPAADAQFLSEMVDTVVFVVRAGRSHFAHVEKAVNAIGRERILGVILNGVEDVPGERYYGMPS